MPTKTFQQYKAAHDFNFGPLDGLSISSGTRMEFNGETLNIDGTTYACPKFQLAVKAGFVIPEGQEVHRYVAKSSNVKVNTAKSDSTERTPIKMGVVIEDETHVGKARPSLEPPVPQPNRTVEEADAINSARIASETQKPVDTNYIKGGTLQSSLSEKKASGEGTSTYGVLTADGTSQGVVIGKVKGGPLSAAVGSEGTTSKKASMDVTKVTSEALEASLKPQTIEGIQGIAATTTQTHRPVNTEATTTAPPERSIMVNPPKPMPKAPEINYMREGDTLVELLPDAYVAPPLKKAVPDSQKELDAIISGWNKRQHWKSRVSEALSYADWPEAISAICAIEAPSVVKHIKLGLK